LAPYRQKAAEINKILFPLRLISREGVDVSLKIILIERKSINEPRNG
jgi:hypothetical protein